MTRRNRHYFGAAVVVLFTTPATSSSSALPTVATFNHAVSGAKRTMMADPMASLADAQRAEQLAASMPAQDRMTSRATAEWLQSEALLRLNRPEAAKSLVNAALRLIGGAASQTALHGDLLISKGHEASESGQAAQALSYYQKAYRVFQAIRDDRSRSRALIAMAIIYDEAYDHDNALKYYEQALDAYKADAALSYSIYSNTGQTFKEMKRYDKGEAQTRLALAMAKALRSPAMVGHTLRALARIELLLHKTAAADKDIEQAFHLIEPNDDEHSELLATAAQAALQHGRIAQAVSLIGRSFADIDPEKTPLGFRERHQTAYDVYRASGDSANALIHLAAMKRLDDEATRLATSTNAALMGARFDYANQELRIAKLKAQEAARTLAFERTRARFQQRVFAGVLAGIAVVVAMLVMGLRKLRRSRNEVARANVVLGETNASLEKALAAKTEFLATTSHEIRTPLNGILGMTQVMLVDGQTDPATRERIGIVHTAGLTMRALVDDILDVAKMENGHLSLEIAPVNLCGLLGELVKLWREQAAAKGLVFEADLSDCPAWIMGDAARLRQVVFNLLGNAVKFTDSGFVRLRAWRTKGENPRYRVAVADSGVGVAEAKHSMIFEAFQQGDSGTTRRFGGTGLGLAISRRLARAMGGDVSVASVPGEGSVFTLDLPLVNADAEDARDSAPKSGPALLVIEHNPITRGMYKALLTPQFGDVAFAASVAEAAAMLSNGGIAQLLANDATLRLHGPLDRAVACLAAAADTASGPGATCITLLWTPTQDEDRPRLIDAGADSVLLKPISRNELLKSLVPNLCKDLGELDCRAA